MAPLVSARPSVREVPFDPLWHHILVSNYLSFLFSFSLTLHSNKQISDNLLNLLELSKWEMLDLPFFTYVCLFVMQVDYNDSSTFFTGFTSTVFFLLRPFRFVPKISRRIEIKPLTSNMAHGLYSFTVSILKLVRHAICQALIKIFNIWVSNGSFPAKLKTA